MKNISFCIIIILFQKKKCQTQNLKLLFENGILPTLNHYTVDLKLICCISQIYLKKKMTYSFS